MRGPSEIATEFGAARISARSSSVNPPSGPVRIIAGPELTNETDRPGASRPPIAIPPDAEDARKVRLRDRFFDLYIHLPMQKIVGDRLRPADRKDPHGVEEARTQIVTALDMIERGMLQQPWAIGEAFTLADCAAAPSLFYADKVMPFGATHPHAAAYLERLKQRPSYARVLEEAEPYFKFFPQQ